LGVAGATARAFINSPLTPLLLLACLAVGLLGLILTPRQEDPDISVPMIDIFVSYPGASAKQVTSLAISPLERLMSEIPGVKHIYSAAHRDRGMVTVEFKVGEELVPSLLKLYDKLASNLDLIPPGVSEPMVKPKSIDDVPIVTLTFWSRDVDDAALRSLALDVLQRIEEIPNTGMGFVVGGRSEQIRIEALPRRLAGFQMSLDELATTIRTANSEKRAGKTELGENQFIIFTGSFLRSADEVARLVVGIRNDHPVYVGDVAHVSQGPEETNRLVNYYTGPAGKDNPPGDGAPAVTLAIAKKKGSNGVTVARDILGMVDSLKGSLIPDNVQVTVTRDYGKTANDKVNELLGDIYLATFGVTIIMLLTMGLRPAVVVCIVIPIVILVTVFSAMFLGFTINRVSLFALVFSIGILVDDATVVVENTYRRWLAGGTSDLATAVDAVREVGNPTIVATFTIVAALIPMAFVPGMMGPYMRPIPILGSAAMTFSLFAAFVFTPWVAARFSPPLRKLADMEVKEKRFHARMKRLYSGILRPLIHNRALGLGFLITLIVAWFLSASMFYTHAVVVKILPLDNKAVFNVVVNMPSGKALAVTANVTRKLTEALRANIPEITALQTYVGTASPFDFNGMVRHYYLREEPWQANIEVQLLDKHERSRSNHQIAVAARKLLTPIARDLGARNISVVEMPPGPPVLESVVAEIYGPSADMRRQVARDMTRFFREVPNITDADNYMLTPFDVLHFKVDTEKAVRRGISTDTINRAVEMAMGGYKLGDVKQGEPLEPTFLVVQVPLGERSQLGRLLDLPIPTVAEAPVVPQAIVSRTVPLAELGRFVREPIDPIVYHKDLRPVEYVVGDVQGRLGAPIYGMFEVADKLADYTAPDGTKLAGHYFGAPDTFNKAAFSWAGEWTVTVETFVGLGVAFCAALFFIYMIIVGEFSSFLLPAIIMMPIPLTMLGIIPGHWLVGAEFTATSMIGFIALAGIIVRNSILLVDFAKVAVQEQGMTVEDAVIQAVEIRTRPIIITAATTALGSSVMLTDPIFQGMAASIMFGMIASTLLTLVVIPLGCVSARRAFLPAPEAAAPGTAVPAAPAPEPAAAEARGRRLHSLRQAALAGAQLMLGVLIGIAITLSRLLWQLVRAGWRLAARRLSPAAASGPQAPAAAPPAPPAAAAADPTAPSPAAPEAPPPSAPEPQAAQATEPSELPVEPAQEATPAEPPAEVPEQAPDGPPPEPPSSPAAAAGERRPSPASARRRGIRIKPLHASHGSKKPPKGH
jgi:multidrug efflux pump subunit AcrB